MKLDEIAANYRSKNIFITILTLNCFLIYVNASYSESESYVIVSNYLQPHGLYSPWNSPGQNTGVGSHSLRKELKKLFFPRVLVSF